MITTQNIKFSFRSKFEKLLTDGNRQSVNSLFQQFCNMNSYYATEILWKMTYNGVEPSFDVYRELGIKEEALPSVKLSTLRNELRYQYEKLHHDFMNVYVPDECKEAFNTLAGRSDTITAAVVYEHCQRAYIECEVKRILFLLQSEEERNYYGGIRSLIFSRDEANYLKPFHVQIFNLFKAYCDYMQQTDDLSANKPFAGLDKLIQEARKELIGGTQKEESGEVNESQQVQDEPKKETVQTSSEFKPLTPNEIKDHKDVFMLFLETGDLNDLVQIGKLGFDLNKVMAKKEKIRKFLQAEEARIEAVKALNEANEAKKRAARAFAESLKNFSEATKALEEE